ncbi:MAG: hypothetical protein FWD57_06670, partial [Polyangiaceae bacterium]|nr:hypothetical protein [Polyangiaceae bacterium]
MNPPRLIVGLAIQTFALAACTGFPGLSASGNNVGYNPSGGTNTGQGGTIINCNHPGACVTGPNTQQPPGGNPGYGAQPNSGNPAQPGGGYSSHRCWGAYKPDAASLIGHSPTRKACIEQNCGAAIQECNQNEKCLGALYANRACRRNSTRTECDEALGRCIDSNTYEACVVYCMRSGNNQGCLYNCTRPWEYSARFDQCGGWCPR